jgi:hypothetical protein
MEVARAASSPMRSSIRRSTPGMGDAVQSSWAAWTAARAPKSELRLSRRPLAVGGLHPARIATDSALAGTGFELSVR